MVLRSQTTDRVRTLTLARPDALNAFNEELYDALAQALLDAAEDPGVAVVLLTGEGRAFSAGTDLLEMHQRNSDPDFVPGEFGFPGLLEALIGFEKPLVVAVNGLGLGVGATILGYADLAFMSSTARLKCPFTSLGVAPEAASSYLLPRLVGRQQAAWMLMSSEWIDAERALAMGLVLEVCAPDDLLDVAMAHARTLAAMPISSLVAVKQTMLAAIRPAIEEARDREHAAFVELLGAPANVEALTAFAERRPPDFASLPAGS